MAEMKMISVLSTDFGDYVVPESVADKINVMPKVEYRSPYSDETLVLHDLSYPPLARYLRRVEAHMKRIWLSAAPPD